MVLLSPRIIDTYLSFIGYLTKIDRVRSRDAWMTSIDQSLSAAIEAAISGLEKLSYQEPIIVR